MIRHIPNILTLGRLVLTFVFLAMVLYSPNVQKISPYLDIAFVLFVIAGLTDIIDGKIARKYNVTSKFGRILDPLVDKVLVVGAFASFAVIGKPPLFDFSVSAVKTILWTVVAIVAAREIYVTVLRQIAESRGVSFGAIASGKFKMFLQSFAIGTLVVKMAHVPTAAWGNWFTTVVLLAMLFVTVYSGLQASQRKSWKEAAAKSPTPIIS